MHSEQPPLARLITGAILAGGESRRLGRDKAQVNLGGRPLASWVAESLGPQVADLWLITNHPLAHLTLGLPILTDLIPGQGPLGGLHTALFYALTPWVLAVAVDCPFLDPALVAHLAARALKTSRPALVYGSARGLEPFPGLYHKRLAPQLETFLATDRRLRIFVEQRRPEIISLKAVPGVDPHNLSFLNLNTPGELARAEELGKGLFGGGGQGPQAPAPSPKPPPPTPERG